MANLRMADSRDFTIINWLDKIEGPGSATISGLATNMENEDDPWDWSIDRVVQEFCTVKRSWELRSSSMVVPDPEPLEAALRDQEITGDTLLNELDNAVLKTELGLRTIGQRAYVNHGISALRLRSAKYRAANQVQPPVISRLMLDELARLIKTSSEGFADQAREDEVQIEDDSSASGRKRQKLDKLDAAAAEIDHSFAEVDNERSMLSAPIEEVDTTNINGKKRKRIAPTLITSEIDLDRVRHMPSAADFVTLDESAQEPQLAKGTEFATEPEPQPAPEPGVTFRDDDGRKRMVPVWQSEPIHEIEAGPSTATVPTISRRKSSKTTKHIPAYLGKKHLAIDEVFYHGVLVGEELTKDDTNLIELEELSMVKTNIPAGQRLYVHSAVKRFLRSEPRQFRRLGELFTAIVPYPERLTSKYNQQSFSLYSSGHARRQTIDSWPEVNTSTLR